MQINERVLSGINLNKPLPPSPTASTISFGTMSSSSEYSQDVQEQVGHNNEEETESGRLSPASHHGHLFSPPTSVLQDKSVMSIPQSYLQDFSAPQLSQHYFSTKPYAPTANVGALEPVQNNSTTSVFKSLSYDQLDQRPLRFYPQGSLIDLAERKKNKKISIGSLLRRNTPKAAHGQRPEMIEDRIPPPRPLRPPRHLCPSPPYNPANMPNWKGETISQLDLSEELKAAKLGKKREERIPQWIAKESQPALTASLPPTVQRKREHRNYFVDKFELHRGLEGSRDSTTLIDSRDEQIGSSLQDTRPKSLENNYDSRFHQQWFRGRSTRRAVSANTVGENAMVPRIAGSGVMRPRYQTTTMTKLEHVPEHTSLQSFNSETLHVANKRNGKHSSMSTVSSISRSDIDLEDQAYQRGRDRVKRISHDLRAQFQQEWEDQYIEGLRRVEQSDASCPSTNSSLASQYKEDSFKDSHWSNAGDYFSHATSQWASSDSNDRELSATLARLAELCRTSQSYDRSGGNHSKSMYGETSDMEKSGVDLSTLLPPPLHVGSPARGVEMDRSETSRKPADDWQKHSEAHHKSPGSSSSACKSSIRRLTNGLNFDASSASTPVTEFGQWMYEAQCRTPSPHLTTSPHPPQPRVRHSPFLIDTAASMSSSTQASSSPWDLTRVRSALRLSRALSNESKVPPRPRRSRSVSFTSPAESSLSQYTDYIIEEEEEDSEDEMFYHQNLGLHIARPRAPPAISERSRSPSPPPLPSRSSRRPIPKPQNPHLSMTKAELNGVAELSSSRSRAGSEASSRESDDDKSEYRSGASTPVSRESIIPEKVYGPFRQMSYRGRSVMYHVNAQGEYTF